MNNDDILKLLKKLEWSSGFMSSGLGPWAKACPICKGVCPKDDYAGHFDKDAQGHKRNCRLKKAIKELSPAELADCGPSAQRDRPKKSCGLCESGYGSRLHDDGFHYHGKARCKRRSDRGSPPRRCQCADCRQR